MRNTYVNVGCWVALGGSTTAPPPSVAGYLTWTDDRSNYYALHIEH